MARAEVHIILSGGLAAHVKVAGEAGMDCIVLSDNGKHAAVAIGSVEGDKVEVASPSPVSTPKKVAPVKIKSTSKKVATSPQE